MAQHTLIEKREEARLRWRWAKFVAAARLTDDRGAPRQLWVSPFQAESSPLCAWVAGRTAELLSFKRSPALALTPLCVSFTLWVGALILAVFLGPTVGSFLVPAVVLVMFMSMGLFTVRTSLAGFRLENERIVQTSVALGLCAACGYDLLGLQVQADGCKECPECGAAWRATRIVRTMPLVLMDTEATELGLWKRIGRLFTGAFTKPFWWGKDDRGRRTPLIHSGIHDRIAAEKEPGMRARMRRGTRKREWGKIRLRMLHEGLCPSCAHDLRGRPAEEDGLVVCPVCTASWQSGRVA